MAEDIRFPGTLPDYLEEQDREGGYMRGLHGIGWVHVSLLRGMAGDFAVGLSQSVEPSSRMMGRKREAWLDEAANALIQFCPPQFEKHRWSTGAPGAHCLDCGIDCAVEHALSCGECILPAQEGDDEQKVWYCPEHRALAETRCIDIWICPKCEHREKAADRRWCSSCGHDAPKSATISKLVPRSTPQEK